MAIELISALEVLNFSQIWRPTVRVQETLPPRRKGAIRTVVGTGPTAVVVVNLDGRPPQNFFSYQLAILPPGKLLEAAVFRRLAAMMKAVTLRGRSLGVRLNLVVVGITYLVFSWSLAFQPVRWASTPAYHVLLQVATQAQWGTLFGLCGAALLVSASRVVQRWIVIASLTASFALTTGWMLAFVVRYLSSPNTTPETLLSWFAFDYLLARVAMSLDSSPDHPPAADTSPDITQFKETVNRIVTEASAAQRIRLAAAVTSWEQCRDDVVRAADDYAAAAAGREEHDLARARAAVSEAQHASDMAQAALDEVLRLGGRE